MGLLTSLLGQQPNGTGAGFGLPPMGATGSPMQGQNAGLLGQLLFGPGGMQGLNGGNGLFGLSGMNNGGGLFGIHGAMQGLGQNGGLLGLLMPQYFGGQSAAQPNGMPTQLTGAGFGAGGPILPPHGMMPGAQNNIGAGGYYGAGPSGPSGMSGGGGVGQSIPQPNWGVPQGWQSPLAQYGGQKQQGL